MLRSAASWPLNVSVRPSGRVCCRFCLEQSPLLQQSRITTCFQAHERVKRSKLSSQQVKPASPTRVASFHARGRLLHTDIKTSQRTVAKPEWVFSATRGGIGWRSKHNLETGTGRIGLQGRSVTQAVFGCEDRRQSSEVPARTALFLLTVPAPGTCLNQCSRGRACASRHHLRVAAAAHLALGAGSRVPLKDTCLLRSSRSPGSCIHQVLMVLSSPFFLNRACEEQAFNQDCHQMHRHGECGGAKRRVRWS